MKASKLISLIFLFSGVVTLFFVVMPVIKFQIWEALQTKNNLPLISPDSEILGVSIQQTPDNFPAFISNAKRESISVFTNFYLDIPSLKIEKAEVSVDSNDLSLGLAHLPGTALPGEKGNVFISGHSILPIFQKSRNAVFAKLPDIKENELIKISVLGTQFTYQVVKVKVVEPKDLSVINPPDPVGRYLTLMTCVPPGLNTKRLIVLAKLI